MAIAARLALTALLTTAIKGAATADGISVPWWLAAATAAVVVYGGWFVIADAARES